MAFSLATGASAAFIGMAGTVTAARTAGYSAGLISGEFTHTITSGPAALTSALGYTAATSLGANSFQTFCIELIVAIANNGHFKVYSIADSGGNSTNAGDPMGAGTAWL